jgi:hypothetical protein
MDVTLTIALPTTREDGSAVRPADIASLNIFRADGANAAKPVGSLAGPFATPTVTYTDHNAPSGTDGYSCDGVEKGKEGDVSDVLPVVVAAPLAKLSAPVIVSATQA